jgi:hypothetical protein
MRSMTSKGFPLRQVLVDPSRPATLLIVRAGRLELALHIYVANRAREAAALRAPPALAHLRVDTPSALYLLPCPKRYRQEHRTLRALQHESCWASLLEGQI